MINVIIGYRPQIIQHFEVRVKIKTKPLILGVRVKIESYLRKFFTQKIGVKTQFFLIIENFVL